MAKLKPNQVLLDGHVITEIPLLFQTEMVQAVMEDRKTQTRRTRGLEGLDNYYFQSLVHHASGNFTFVENGNYNPKNEDVKVAKCPYGKPGDLLWVRETFLILEPEHCKGYEDRFLYKANFHPESEELRREYMEVGYPYQWKPSIHMPKSAARIWLMVDEIRVERLQDITEKDAIAEGILTSGKQYYHYLKDKWGPSPIHSFQTLWQSINGPGSWDANPWVWVVKFCMLSSSGRPSEEMIRAGYNHFTKEVTNG